MTEKHHVRRWYKMPVKLQDTIVSAYQEGEDVVDMSVRLAMPARSIYKVLQRRNVEVRGSRTMTDMTEQEMLARYNAGENLQEIADAYSHPRTTVRGAILRQGGVLRSGPEVYRQYAANDSFFSTIDSEEKAYILGWWSGDGNVASNGRTICTFVNIIDKAHIELLKDRLGFTGPLYYRPASTQRIGEKIVRGGPQVGIQIGSRQMIADLALLGVLPGKSLTIRPWDGPDHLMRHYYRGLADADGGCRVTYGGGFYMCGNKWMVDGFADFVRKATGSKAQSCGDPKASEEFRKVQFNGQILSAKVCRLLYGECTIALARKLETARQLMPHADRVTRAQFWATQTKEKLLALKESQDGWRGVADHLGVKAAYLYRHLIRLGLRHKGFDQPS